MSANHLAAACSLNAAALVLFVALSAGAQSVKPGIEPSESASARLLHIMPLTQVDGNGQGYMADPQPIRLAPMANSKVQYISGTTKALLRCEYPIRPNCFSWTPMSVNAGSLNEAITAAGAHVTNIQNTDIFQDNEGGWHAAITLGIASTSHPKHWTVIAHAHGVNAGADGMPPLIWSADKLLSGSFSEAGNGNYDGKYFEDNGHLYLLYVEGIAPPPNLRNAIVIQSMLSPETRAAVAPTVLLTTGDRQGELNSAHT
jgi:hypothetical protein